MNENEVSMQAVKRAMPGRGRARIHESLLQTLCVEDMSEVEITAGQKTITLAIFSDDLVDKGQIRVGGEDLKALGIPNGGEVQVRRKIPIDEQFKRVAGDAREMITKGAEGVGTAIGEMADKVKTSASDAADAIGTSFKEISEKVTERGSPIGEMALKTAKSSVRVVKDKISIGRFSPDVEAGIKALSDVDADTVRSKLRESDREVGAATVKAAQDRTIANLTIPPEGRICALQREGSLIAITPDTILKPGDIIYLQGSVEALDFIRRMVVG